MRCKAVRQWRHTLGAGHVAQQRRKFSGRQCGAIRHQREMIWTTYGVHRQIHIQQRPVQMVRRWMFNGDDLVNSGLSEPRKLLERKMQFFIPEQQPEPVLGDMRNFSCRSDVARHIQPPKYVLGRWLEHR